MNLSRLLAAGAAATLPLWPSVAHAEPNPEPDQKSWHWTTFQVDGVQCRVIYGFERNGARGSAWTSVDDVMTPQPECTQGVQTEVEMRYDSDGGVSRTSGGSSLGLSSSTYVDGVRTVKGSTHSFYFQACDCWHTFSSK